MLCLTSDGLDEHLDEHKSINANHDFIILDHLQRKETKFYDILDCLPEMHKIMAYRVWCKNILILL